MIEPCADRPVRAAVVSRNPKAIDRKAMRRSATILAASCRRAAAWAQADEREHLLDVATIAETVGRSFGRSIEDHEGALAELAARGRY